MIDYTTGADHQLYLCTKHRNSIQYVNGCYVENLEDLGNLDTSLARLL